MRGGRLLSGNGNTLLHRLLRLGNCRTVNNRSRVLLISLAAVTAAVQITVLGIYTTYWLLLRVQLRTTAVNFPTRTLTHGKWLRRLVGDFDNVTNFLNGSALQPLYQLTEIDPFVIADALQTVGNRTCFVDGLDETNGTQRTKDGCTCHWDWFGQSCSVPGFIQRSLTPFSKDRLRLRSTPRRVVNAFPFNIELAAAELRFSELADVVDVFIVLESNYTAYGTSKPLLLRDRLLSESFESVADKIVYVLLDFFPPEARRDGWIADGLHRNYLGTHGLSRVRGLRSDDLLILNDADEIPRRDVVTFLKWHDGYAEPVLFSYRWSVFGFFWGVPDANGVMKTQDISSAVTVGMAIYVFRYQIYFVRSPRKFFSTHQFDVQVYEKMFKSRMVRPWTAGSNGSDVAGWHCSWCLDIEGIRVKLTSAQNGDFPRWGDYPDKLNLTYLRGLVARGMWFDDKSTMKRYDVISGPRGLLADIGRYWTLIHNVYRLPGSQNETTTSANGTSV